MQDKKSWIAYVDDDDEKRNCFCDIIEINQTYVKFATSRNVLIIPLARVLKIKESNDAEAGA